jgi:uncharacterized surface protein with fasciclin (FAS1) repeats
LLYSLLYHICQGTISVEQKQHYNKYDIEKNTATITVEQKQPYDKYYIVKNTATIPVEQKNKL